VLRSYAPCVQWSYALYVYVTNMEHHVLDALEGSGTGEGCDDKKRGGGGKRKQGLAWNRKGLNYYFWLSNKPTASSDGAASSSS
jgi:hypothetical protein